MSSALSLFIGLGLVSECIRIRVPQKAAQRVLNARQATVSMPNVAV